MLLICNILFTSFYTTVFACHNYHCTIAGHGKHTISFRRDVCVIFFLLMVAAEEHIQAHIQIRHIY